MLVDRLYRLGSGPHARSGVRQDRTCSVQRSSDVAAELPEAPLEAGELLVGCASLT